MIEATCMTHDLGQSCHAGTLSIMLFRAVTPVTSNQHSRAGYSPASTQRGAAGANSRQHSRAGNKGMCVSIRGVLSQALRTRGMLLRGSDQQR
jgi:hypothetical protein